MNVRSSSISVEEFNTTLWCV
eukprot:SAG31_NODE_47864_length_211_cov_21.258929_1_plen_20_part_10